jgi:GrpB-like predicted nucleotidyltransferase (UPF0157 family)
VILHPYDERWPERFAELSAVISAAVTVEHFDIHHVGSTSVPGMIAKPIIDMDLVMSDYGVFPRICEDLSRLGYRNNGDQGIKDRIVFKPLDDEVPYCSPRRRWYPHHLYVCPAGSEELRRHLLFRDWLRENEEARADYARIKREIEAESGNDRKAYALMKETRARAFVEEILRRSRA